MKNMKLTALLSVLCVAFVLISATPEASAVAEYGTKGDLLGVVIMWGWHQRGSIAYSYHWLWLQNDGRRPATYTWEIKSGIPELGVSVEILEAGKLRKGESTSGSAQPLELDLVAERVPRRTVYTWSMYTRIDADVIGAPASTWRVDSTSMVSH